MNNVDILRSDVWEDEAVWFGNNVDFDKFTLEVKAFEGRLE